MDLISVMPDGRLIITEVRGMVENDQARKHRIAVRKYLDEHGLWTLDPIDWRTDTRWFSTYDQALAKKKQQ